MSSTYIPETETPITLRSDRELTGQPIQRNELPRTAPARSDPQGLPVATLTMAGVVAVAGVGWFVQRRSRLAAQQAAAAPAPVDEQPMLRENPALLSGVPAPQAPSLPVAGVSPEAPWPREIEPEPAPQDVPPLESLPHVEAMHAPELTGEPGLPPDSILPQELALALGRELMVVAPPPSSSPPDSPELEAEVRPRRPAAWSVAFRKFMIRFLLLARTVAGGSSIMAAIAIAVFWAIESIDSSTRETQLNMVLLGLVLAAGVGAWCCGWIANQLHRSLYNRNHPKFDD